MNVLGKAICMVFLTLDDIQIVLSVFLGQLSEVVTFNLI